MKRIILSLLIIFTLNIFHNSIGFTTSFDPSSYTFLAVTSPYSSPVLYFPTINNSGEIVGMNENVGGIGGHNQLVSTVRGVLPLATSYVYNNVGFPDMNDSGEVVYKVLDGTPGGSKIYSTTRGFIAEGNLPGINNLGEVSYSDTQPTPDRVFSNQRGIIAEYYYPNPALGPSNHLATDINDSGEIVWDHLDHNGVNVIESNVRGQLTSGGSPSINNHGDVVYTIGGFEDRYIYSLDGNQITDFPVGIYIDLNDFGDIVFNAESFYDYYVNSGRPIGSDIPITDWESGIHSELGSAVQSFYTVLGTQNPDRYSQYPAFHYVEAGKVVPEPATMILLGSGLFGLAVIGRKRFKK